MKLINLKTNYLCNPVGIANNITLSWCYDCTYERDMTQESFEILIAKDPDMTQIIYTSEIIKSSEMHFHVEYDFSSMTEYFWQVKTVNNLKKTVISDINTFECAISSLGKWITTGLTFENEPDSITFSRQINLENVLKARLYVYGQGFTSICINDEYYDDRMLAPANSNYEKHCYFETYDILNSLQLGENLIKIQVAGGYDKHYSEFGFRHLDIKGVRATIALTLADNTIKTIDTNNQWIWSENNITFSSIYGGEHFDATRNNLKEHKIVVNENKAPKGKLLPREIPQIQIYKTCEPISKREIDCGFIYDFGYNASGVPSIEVDAEPGVIITLSSSELITHNGELSPWTNRSAEAVDVYTCSGKGREKYFPRTTYHGFRYIHVAFSNGIVNDFKINALYFSSAVNQTGSFSCSDPMINQIQENAVCSLQSNLLTIPTDCNMRDERTPCQMDSMIVEEAVNYNFDMTAFYNKWVSDYAGEMGPPAWNSDPLSAAWHLWREYGDLQSIKKHYNDFKSLIEYQLELSQNYIFEEVVGNGDWCHPNENNWPEISGNFISVNTSMFYVMTKRMSIFAEELGKIDDAIKFADIAKKIQSEYASRVINEDGSSPDYRQANYLLPIYYGLVEGETANRVYECLLNKLKENKQLDVGIFGMQALLDVPANFGNIDEVFKYFKTSNYPSFGWQIVNSAKSLWEQWAFFGVMHSHNHAMFASISASFYKVLAGIKAIEPGFRRFAIKPILPKGMAYAGAELETISGKISTMTKIMHGSPDKKLDWIDMAITIPANTTAEIYIPAPKQTNVMFFDGDLLLDKKSFKKVGEHYMIICGSGKYNYRIIPSQLVFKRTKISKNEIGPEGGLCH